MFGKLKSIFKKAEEDVQEKVEAKIEKAPAEDIEEIAESEEKDEELKEEIEEPPNTLDDNKIEELPEKSSYKEQTKEEIKESEKELEKKVKLGFKAKLKTKLGGRARLSESEIEDITWNLQMALMQSDVAMEVAEAIAEKLREKLSSEEFSDPRGQIRQIFKSTLVEILEAGGELDFLDFVRSQEKPVKIVFFGINGCGKTTTIARITQLLKENGISVVLAAGDTFRAGAEEQLGKHAERLGVKMIHHQRGGDAAAVVFDAIKHAEANDIDVVLADTSGRMQSDTDLMGEMEKIVRVSKPDLRVFVGDSLTGNDAVDQARKFNEKVGIDAAILAKFDASKGGAALSVSQITGKPIIFLGVGQDYGDLQRFDAKTFVDEIL